MKPNRNTYRPRALIILGAMALMLSACGASADDDGGGGSSGIRARVATSVCGFVEASCGHAGLYGLTDSSVSGDPNGHPITQYVFTSVAQPTKTLTFEEPCGDYEVSKDIRSGSSCSFDFSGATRWFIVYRDTAEPSLIAGFREADGTVFDASGERTNYASLAALQEEWERKLARMPDDGTCGDTIIEQDAPWCGEASDLYP